MCVWIINMWLTFAVHIQSWGFFFWSLRLVKIFMLLNTVCYLKCVCSTVHEMNLTFSKQFMKWPLLHYQWWVHFFHHFFAVYTCKICAFNSSLSSLLHLLVHVTAFLNCSKGRHGHVNYRDSKLTRILQPALGGNARTAIICTLSPARSHVEQSRNTLLFACCAKEVSTNAQVNVVMSDKALVKHLQKELARLESELKTPTTTCDHVSLLRKKDQQIEKVSVLSYRCSCAYGCVLKISSSRFWIGHL